MDWLLEHQSAVQSYALMGAFACIAIWETFSPRREAATSLASRWLSNLSLTVLGSLLVKWLLPLVALAAATLAQEQHWGLLNLVAMPVWLTCAVGVVALDLANYGQHRLFHAIPALWRVHQIHHSDLDVDWATAIRHHPLEAFAAEVLQLAVIFALGAPPLAVLLFALLSVAASFFNHGNIALAPGMDRFVRHVFVTPDMHRIHHSVLHVESNSNYANLFSWWDRTFSTYRRDPAQGHAQMELGLATARSTKDVVLWKLLMLPFRRAEAADPLAPARGVNSIAQRGGAR